MRRLTMSQWLKEYPDAKISDQSNIIFDLTDDGVKYQVQLYGPDDFPELDKIIRKGIKCENWIQKLLRKCWESL